MSFVGGWFGSSELEPLRNALCHFGLRLVSVWSQVAHTNGNGRGDTAVCFQLFGWSSQWYFTVAQRHVSDHVVFFLPFLSTSPIPYDSQFLARTLLGIAYDETVSRDNFGNFVCLSSDMQWLFLDYSISVIFSNVRKWIKNFPPHVHSHTPHLQNLGDKTKRLIGCLWKRANG